MIKVIRIPTVRLVTPTAIGHALSVKLLPMNILMTTGTGFIQPAKLLHLVFHVTTSTSCRLMFGYQRVSRLIVVKSNAFPISRIVASCTRLIGVIFSGQFSLMNIFMATFALNPHVVENPFVFSLVTGKARLRLVGSINLEFALFVIVERK